MHAPAPSPRRPPTSTCMPYGQRGSEATWCLQRLHRQPQACATGWSPFLLSDPPTTVLQVKMHVHLLTPGGGGGMNVLHYTPTLPRQRGRSIGM